MRILHVSERVSPLGGAERMLRDTCRLLADAGHGVAALVAEDTPVVDFPYPIERLPRSTGTRDARRVWPLLAAAIDRLHPDIVHLHNLQDFLSPVLVPRLRRVVPTLRYVHDARLFCPRLRSKWLARGDRPCTYRMGARCALHCWPIDAGGGQTRPWRELARLYLDLVVARGLPAVLVGSAYMRAQLLLNGFAQDRVHVLPCFTTRVCRRAGHPAGDPLILAVGRFDDAKGLDRLPAILGRLRQARWRAVIVGAGVLRAAAIDESRGLGIDARIEFAEWLSPERIDELYAAAAVTVLPSRVPEAFGIVGIEALAHAVPVVAYDLGGVREWLADRRTGLLVPAGDEAAFASAIDELLADPAFAARCGAAGLDAVERSFRPAQHLAALLAVYGQLVSAAGR